jgi:integration host factor subunit beta
LPCFFIALSILPDLHPNFIRLPNHIESIDIFQLFLYYLDLSVTSGGSMNKLNLIETLKKEANLTKNEAATVVKLFFGEMANALASGERVEIRGLCSFYVKKYKGYTGRNPKTGEKVIIKPKKLPFFKCGKELKERVDG